MSSGYAVVHNYLVSNHVSSEFSSLPALSSALLGVLAHLQQATSLIFNSLSNSSGQRDSLHPIFKKKKKSPPELCLPLLTLECFD